jgi:hypothetical protein
MEIRVGVKGHERVSVLDERFTDWFISCDKISGSPTVHFRFDHKTAFKNFDEQLAFCHGVAEDLNIDKDEVHPSSGHFFIKTSAFESKDHSNPESDKNFLKIR